MSRRDVITWKADFFFPVLFFSNDRLFNASRDVEPEKQKIRVGVFFFEAGNEYGCVAIPPPPSFARGPRVHLKGIAGSASALTEPQRDYISSASPRLCYSRGNHGVPADP